LLQASTDRGPVGLTHHSHVGASARPGRRSRPPTFGERRPMVAKLRCRSPSQSGACCEEPLSGTE
jgi:hypothetical protein